MVQFVSFGLYMGGVALYLELTYDTYMKISKGPEEFIPLDNSALIYPTTVARYNSHMFRLSMDLYGTVVPERLLTALEHIIERFPYYAVSLHHGFFWYYLSPHNKPLKVYPERSYPCAFLHRKKGANGYLFKVLYGKHRVAVEYFHALTDGTGGLYFFKSLLAEYLRLSGIEVGPDPQIFRPGEHIDEEESADSFQRFYRPLKSVFARETPAFHYNGKGEIVDRIQVISARIAIPDIKALSSSLGVTITEYLVAELMDALQRVQEQVKKPKAYKPIRIQVPVNIRKIFESKSMRNFTLFVVVGIDPRLGHYSFDEILQQVKFQMRGGVNAKTLSRQISRNVAGGRHVLIRYAPNFIKMPLMKILSDTYGDGIYTSSLSNIGDMSLPEGMREVVKRSDFYLTPGKINKVVCAVMGSNGFLSINLASIFANQTIIEREFLTALVNKGIPVEISSNRNPETLER